MTSLCTTRKTFIVMFANSTDSQTNEDTEGENAQIYEKLSCFVRQHGLKNFYIKT